MLGDESPVSPLGLLWRCMVGRGMWLGVEIQASQMVPSDISRMAFHWLVGGKDLLRYHPSLACWGVLLQCYKGGNPGCSLFGICWHGYGAATPPLLWYLAVVDWLSPKIFMSCLSVPFLVPWLREETSIGAFFVCILWHFQFAGFFIFQFYIYETKRKPRVFIILLFLWVPRSLVCLPSYLQLSEYYVCFLCTMSRVFSCTN